MGIEKIPNAPVDAVCKHPEHNPPMHIVIPQGYQLRHKCPGCGKERILRTPQSWLEEVT